jgi:hypothetical protein
MNGLSKDFILRAQISLQASIYLMPMLVTNMEFVFLIIHTHFTEVGELP